MNLPQPLTEGRLLREAVHSGVEALAYRTIVSTQENLLDQQITVQL